jgi:hypothetical protein
MQANQYYQLLKSRILFVSLSLKPGLKYGTAPADLKSEEFF